MIPITKIMDDFHQELKLEQRIMIIENYRKKLVMWRRDGRVCLYAVNDSKGCFKGFVEAKSLEQARKLLCPGEKLMVASDGFIYPILMCDYGSGEHSV